MYIISGELHPHAISQSRKKLKSYMIFHLVPKIVCKNIIKVEIRGNLTHWLYKSKCLSCVILGNLFTSDCIRNANLVLYFTLGSAVGEATNNIK